MTLYNKTREKTAVPNMKTAGTFMERLLGLIVRADLPAGEGLLLEPCSMIHTCFMRFAIDAVFLDKGLKVMRVVPYLRPWRFSPLVLGARSVLELPAGSAAAVISEGDLLEIR